MTHQQTLHIAHWGLRRNNQTLADIIRSQLQTDAPYPGGLYQPAHINSREDFKAYDSRSNARSPILVSGDIGVWATNRLQRLEWDIPKMLTDVYAWLDTAAGEHWRNGPIWLLIPETDDNDLTLLMAIQRVLVEFFEAKNRPYPENLLLETASPSVDQRLMSFTADRHQIIMVADSLLDTAYVARQTNIATRANDTGRILSEATAWVALAPSATTLFHAEFAQVPQGEESYQPLSEHCQAWLAQHYQVGEHILLQHDLPSGFYESLSLHNYRNHCLPPSDMPREAPTSRKKADIAAFEKAIEEAKPINHQLQINALNGILGDSGIAGTLAPLVLTLEQMTQVPTVQVAIVYQASPTDAFQYLIHKEAK